jgi:alkanesulfonate monooxygenase SsuD/methylene tetrahydromethanopterin reductase-like flavin-dependent oxidoreductase (luciferase family)
MQYGFVIPGGDADTNIEVAEEIEAAGWDGVFVADGVYGTDPWISLAAMAMRTERVRLGPMLTPVSRRRPWKLASETATLDRLSHGRVLLPVGLGAPDTGFGRVGEAVDRKTRAQLLDEGLEVITGFWSGKPFSFHGQHFHVDWGSEWAYTPVQSPRIPIWVVGLWPHEASLRRTLRYDGIVAAKKEPNGSWPRLTPDDVRQIRAYAEEHRAATTPFDIVLEGVTPGDDPGQARSIIRPLAEAGATWWIESMWDVPGGMKAVRKRIKQGPPQIE